MGLFDGLVIPADGVIPGCDEYPASCVCDPCDITVEDTWIPLLGDVVEALRCVFTDWGGFCDVDNQIGWSFSPQPQPGAECDPTIVVSLTGIDGKEISRCDPGQLRFQVQLSRCWPDGHASGWADPAKQQTTLQLLADLTRLTSVFDGCGSCGVPNVRVEQIAAGGGGGRRGWTAILSTL